MSCLRRLDGKTVEVLGLFNGRAKDFGVDVLRVIVRKFGGWRVTSLHWRGKRGGESWDESAQGTIRSS